MLYFIRSQKYLKIGYSQDFETLVNRMESYMTHNPDFILISFTEFGEKKDEKAIHKLLKEYQYYTEWFKDNLKVFQIWENYIEKKNLIPKNCFYLFPEDIEKLRKLNYREVWDSPIIYNFDEETTQEEEEIFLLKYFGTKKTFSSEDFIRACKFSEKELNKKVNKNYLEKFGYIISENNEVTVTVMKTKFLTLNLENQ